MDQNRQFIEACRSGNLKHAQYLYSFDTKPNIHAKKDQGFKFACERHKITVAQWLTEICDDYSFSIINNTITNPIISPPFKKIDKLQKQVNQIEKKIDELMMLIKTQKFKECVTDPSIVYI